MSERKKDPAIRAAGLSVRASALFLPFLLAVSSCYDSKVNGTGGDSHFLTSCETACGEGLACICGVCTRICETEASCSDLPGDPSCIPPDTLGASRDCCADDPVSESVCDVGCEVDDDCSALVGAGVCKAGFCRESPADGSDGEPEPDASAPDADAGEPSADAGIPQDSGVALDAEVIILDKPLLMMVVDTSGSMEWKPSCVCTTDACEECLPACNGDPATDEKSRWAVMLETLTGTWESFECYAVERDSGLFTFDRGYPIPHNLPPVGTYQNVDGILDVYQSSIRFGLATFDSQPTYRGAETLISATDFDFVFSLGGDAMWSYGPYDDNTFPYTRDDGSVVGKLGFPNCEEAFVIDTGVKSTLAGPGALFAALDDVETINDRIQTALLDTRPYSNAPIAAALDDLYYFFETDYDPEASGSDTTADRYVLLITDGKPDDDFRKQSGCDCQDREECCRAYHSLDSCDGVADLATNPDYEPSLYQCPYPTSEQVAEALLSGYGEEGGVVAKLFVIGFSLPCNDSDAGQPDYDPSHETEACKTRDVLDGIARAGGSPGALFADDGQQLRDHIESIIFEVTARD